MSTVSGIQFSVGRPRFQGVRDRAFGIGLLPALLNITVPLSVQAKRATGAIHVTAVDPDGAIREILLPRTIRLGCGWDF